MTAQEKLAMLKVILFGSAADTDKDEELSVYLDLTRKEILAFKYSLVGLPDDAVDVPKEDEITQIMACAFGYGQKGAIGELTHNENGIYRMWSHADMSAYIRNHVIPYARVI